MQLLYFSPIPAASYCQRPHFFVEATRKFGIEKVLWVEPYPRRLPRWSDLKHVCLRKVCSPLNQNIEVLQVPALPIEPLPGGTALNDCLVWPGVWKKLTDFVADDPTVIAIGGPSRLALAALSRLSTVASLYDAMDDFPEFYRGLSRSAMRQTERQIAAQVNLVLASSTCLARKFAKLGISTEVVHNACGIRDCPPCQSDRPARKVLGYVGCIADWFDWPLVIQLAESVPDVDVELVGPCLNSPPQPLPANLKMHGACDHRSLHTHMNRFAAGLIPFRVNRLTEAVDPIKYYDYRCFGLPVLSTNFGEMAYRRPKDGVFFLDGDADLRTLVNDAISQSAPWHSTVDFRRSNHWEARFASASRLRSLLENPSNRDILPLQQDKDRQVLHPEELGGHQHRAA
jgi:hypothetical protein